MKKTLVIGLTFLIVFMFSNSYLATAASITSQQIAEIQELRSIAEANSERLRALESTVDDNFSKTIEKVKQLTAENNSTLHIKNEELQVLVETIKKDNKTHSALRNELNLIIPALKAAKEKQDVENAKINLEKLVAIQANLMKSLTKINEDLGKIASLS